MKNKTPFVIYRLVRNLSRAFAALFPFTILAAQLSAQPRVIPSGTKYDIPAAGEYVLSGTIAHAGITGSMPGVTLIIDAGAVVSSSASSYGYSYAMRFSKGGAVVDNSGTISGMGYVSGGYGIYATSSPSFINNRATGMIQGGEIGVLLSGGGTVTNAGVIRSTGIRGYGIDSTNVVATITNNGGTILGETGGVHITGGGTVENTGVIRGMNNNYSYGIHSEYAGVYIINGTTGLIRATSAGINLVAGGTVVNSGTILSTYPYFADQSSGIMSWSAPAFITNNATGLISGTRYGVQLMRGGEVVNSGSIISKEYAVSNYNEPMLVTNSTGGFLSGGYSGVWLQAGGTLINSGTIVATRDYGVYAHDVEVTIANDGGLIRGGEVGIHLLAGGTITNSGTIIGTTVTGITSHTDATITNDGGLIQGYIVGISSLAGGTVTNSGTIIALDRPDDLQAFGIDMTDEATISNIGGLIESAHVGIGMYSGGTVTNSGTIIGTDDVGVAALLRTVVTNTTGGMIRGGLYAVYLGTDEYDDEDEIEYEEHEVHLWNNSRLVGQLYVAGTASKLILNNTPGSEYSYSSAVTGSTTFTGTLIKQGAGGWVMNKDDLDMLSVDVREGDLTVLWDVTQLKDAPVHVEAGAGFGVFAGGDAIVANPLTGSGFIGMLSINDEQPTTFTLTADVGDRFTGTIGIAGGMQTARFNLDDNAEDVLANATLWLEMNAETTLNANRAIGGLDLAGGTFIVKSDPASAGDPYTLTVKTLAVSETDLAAVTKIGIDPAALSGINPPIPSGQGLSGIIFDIDIAPPDYLLQKRTIVHSTESGPADGIAFELIDSNGAPLPSGSTTIIYGQNGETPVGKNTYGFNAITQDGDILINYGLISIEALHDTERLVINPADAIDNTLSAQLTGTGAAGFIFTGSRTIALGNNNNDYTGATLITGSATLTSAGIANIIASSTSVTITADAAFDTGNTTQTLRNLSGAGDIHLGTGAINLINNTDGLVLSGTIDGEGELTLTADSVLTLTGNNTYTGATTIETGAHLQLGEGTGGGDTGMIGSTAVSNSGTLTINRSGDITLVGAITGEGDLIQLGTGTTTLTGANAITGKLVIETGALQIGDGEANGWAQDTDIAADATVNADASLIFNRSDLTTYTGVIDGAGDFATIGSGVVVFEKTQDYTGSTIIKNGTLRLSTENAIQTSRDITLEHGALDLGNKLQTLQNLHATDGAIHYHTPGSNDTTYTTLTISGNYTGETTSHMNVDLANRQTDRLIISGSADGTHHIIFRNMNPTPPDDPRRRYALLVVNYTEGDPLFTSDGVEVGVITYELQKGDGGSIMPDTSAYYLTAGNSISRSGDAILITASVMGADLHYGLDNVHKRMGDIRANIPRDRGNIWARANNYRLNTNSRFGNSSVKQDTYGITIGADKTFVRGKTTLMTGLYAGMSYSDRTFEDAGQRYGDGDSTILGGGLYALLLHDAGWFVDAVLRFDRSENELKARGVDGYLSRGKYKNNIQGISIEAGRRFMNGRYWVEPSVQAAVAWINGADYLMKNDRHRDIQVRINDSDSWQYRAQVRTGADFGRWNPYIKFGAVKTDTNGGKVSVENRSRHPAFEGWRFETGAGVSYLIDWRSQLYLDYEYNKAPHYERPWSINLGYRRAW